MVYVDAGRCSGCGLCVEACPTGAIRLVDGMARVDQGLCRACEACLEACPTGAISVAQEPEGVIRPVPVRAPSPVPSRPTPVVTRPAGRLLPWVGAALAFVGREVVPRVAIALLDAWDRRQAARPAAVSFSPSAGPHMSTRGTPAVVDRGTGAGRRCRRFRRRGRG